MIDLTALRKACDLATPGPWDSDSVDVWNLTDAGQGFEPGRYVDSVDIVSGRCEECGTYQGVKRDSDAAFIAAARSAVPALLDRVAELEAGLREACDLLDKYRGGIGTADRPRVAELRAVGAKP